MMNFKITDVQNHMSPSNLNVDEILNFYGTSAVALENALKNSTFIYHNSTNGFQIELAKKIKEVIEKHFQGIGGLPYRGVRYSSAIRETPDIAIGLKGRSRMIFMEIEFRPNEHKDIIKFLIGHKQQMLELAILIVPIDRKIITKYSLRKYPTMAEFRKCVQIVKELQSDCPIWIMGFNGKWEES